MKKRSPLHEFYEYVTDLNGIVNCTIQGLHGSIDRLDLIDALFELDIAYERATEEDATQKIECANKNAEWAAGIIKSDYQTVYNFAIILLWSKLESTVLDFTHNELQKNKNIIKSNKFEKIQIPISTYAKMNSTEKAHFLVDAICDSCKYNSKPGVDRFESILFYLDLDGKVDHELQKNLYEASQIRNLLLHRSGYADKAFTKNCPHLGLKLGEKIHITKDDLSRYMSSIISYFTIIVKRKTQIMTKTKRRKRISKTTPKHL